MRHKTVEGQEPVRLFKINNLQINTHDIGENKRDSMIFDQRNRRKCFKSPPTHDVTENK
jgi:hypothetical protein